MPDVLPLSVVAGEIEIVVEVAAETMAEVVQKMDKPFVVEACSAQYSLDKSETNVLGGHIAGRCRCLF